jgi:ABC-2 type transport system ATP-binding protein
LPVIQVNDVHKKFKVFHDKGQTFKEKLIFRNRNHYEDRWVLKGVGFEVEKGEAVGLIGHNGCGKSTLLKLMTRIMYPDKGEIKMDGRVSSLIELGAGFHPDMRGKENIYTNASIFGLTKKEIDDRLNEIIAFSELEEYINNPVRTYSSGMYMRLAFSVAINVDADILLIDEILSVGDANFQSKCFEKMRELKASGITIVIVTHDLSTVEKFCTKAVWLNDGNVASSGPPPKVVDDYMWFMAQKKGEAIAPIVPQSEAAEPPPADEQVTETQAEINCEDNRFGLRHIEITRAEMLDKDGRPATVLRALEPASIVISYTRYRDLEGYIFGFGFYSMDGVLITGTNTQLDSIEINRLNRQGRVTLRFDKLPLLSGKYILQVAVVDQDSVPMDYYRNYCCFDVVSSDRGVGLVGFERVWEID